MRHHLLCTDHLIELLASKLCPALSLAVSQGSFWLRLWVVVTLLGFQTSALVIEGHARDMVWNVYGRYIHTHYVQMDWVQNDVISPFCVLNLLSVSRQVLTAYASTI